MADKINLLKLRKQLKRRKPWFVVKESHYRGGRVKVRWRYPIGRHSGVRQEHKGKPALVRIGYGSPRAVRGLHASGLLPIVVSCERDLLQVNSQHSGAVLARTLGMKKRLELLNIALQKKISVLNVKSISQEIEKINAALNLRKQKKAVKVAQKSKKEQEKEKKVAEKEAKEKKEKEAKEKEEKKE